MKRFIYIVGLAAIMSVAALSASDGRPLTRAMRCADAQALVSRQGAIVLNTDTYIYDRYVANRQFCPTTQVTEPAWAPTKDNPRCFIGYTCTEDYDWPF